MAGREDVDDRGSIGYALSAENLSRKEQFLEAEVCMESTS